MKHDRIQKAPSSGFSLTELLVVILIIAVLATLGLMGISTLTKRANATKDAATLRQIWTCVSLYSSDQNGMMPGPLFTAQSPIYNKPIPAPGQWRRLSDCLAPYLGYDNLKSGDFMEAMAASWQKTPETRNSPAYYMQQKLPIGLGEETLRPFGSGQDLTPPMRMSHVMAQPKTDKTWALTEYDQLNPEIPIPNTNTPAGMAHGTYRLGIYFDGRVGRFDVDNNPL